ncbi:MAG: chemotaxis protein CheV [Chromatiales bacterium]|nr:chemotaxis protein CheV [Chromatiales bacterium]
MAGILDGVDQRTRLAGANRLELLLFRLAGRQRFGINVFKVREVIQCPVLTQVPHANRVVRGIANMRGKTIPVMDLSMAIGGPPLTDIASRFVIITEYNRHIQGFLVGSVDRIINMHWESIMPPPQGSGRSSYLTAVTDVDKELVEIIDVEKVLKEVVGVNETVSAGVIDDQADRSAQHVLVADDSLVARKQIERVLNEMQVPYTTVNDGRAALKLLKEWREERGTLKDWLAVVITDIEMPQMDGYSLVAEMRKEPVLSEIYVMMHSSLSGGFNEAMVQRVGADEFIPKYDPDDLAERLERRLEDHRNGVGHVAA